MSTEQVGPPEPAAGVYPRGRPGRSAGRCVARPEALAEPEEGAAHGIGADTLTGERPRGESNHRTQLRRLPLCPLSYGAGTLSAVEGWRTGFEPATTGTTTRGSTS